MDGWVGKCVCMYLCVLEKGNVSYQMSTHNHTRAEPSTTYEQPENEVRAISQARAAAESAAQKAAKLTETHGENEGEGEGKEGEGGGQTPRGEKEEGKPSAGAQVAAVASVSLAQSVEEIRSAGR